MNLGNLLGRLWFYRGKGMLYIEAVRQWVIPIMGGTAAAKYLGMPLKWAIPAWICLAILAECTAVLLGWLERRSGATAANYGLAQMTDPYKVRSIQELERINETLLRWLETPGGGDRVTITRLKSLSAPQPRPHLTLRHDVRWPEKKD